MNNRMITRLAATAAVALVAAAGQAQVFSTNPGFPVPPTGTGPGTMSATLDIAGAPTVTDLNVILDITHTFTGDLDIILVPPSNDRYIHLTSDSGAGGDNFTFTRFDQASPLAISAGVAPAIAPFNGTFAPEGGDIAWRAAASIPLPGFSLVGLDDFIGTDPNGTWTLIIDDDAGGDLGTLNYFSIELNGAIDPNGPSFGLPPTATDTSTPATVVRDGSQSVTLAVTVAPGTAPDSTGLTVVVDDSAVGGGGSLSLLDNGVFPDAAAGDNIFTGTVAIPYTTTLGARVLPYVVSDAQGRTYSETLNFTVTEANGACCIAGGCVVTTVGDCLDVQGGTFAGNATACFSPQPLTTEGAGAFEDISATGTLVADLAGDDDAVSNISLPFTFNFYGIDYTSGNMSTNGNFQFGANNSTAWTNVAIPAAGVPNNALYVLWDDHDFDASGEAYTETRGTPGVDQRFIMQWNNVGQYNLAQPPLDTNTYQIVLFEDGNFEYRYLFVSPETTTDTTTIGFEDPTGTAAVTLAETRDSLSATAPISFRGNSQGQDTGVCGGGSGCPACAADYDQNGGVDGADIGAFFAEFESGAACADVDQNGGVDGGDIGAFFVLFEAGGC